MYEVLIFGARFLECIIVRVFNHYGLFQGFYTSIHLVANCPLLVSYRFKNTRLFWSDNFETLDVFHFLFYLIDIPISLRGQHFEMYNFYFHLIGMKFYFYVQKEASIPQAMAYAIFEANKGVHYRSS